MICQLASDQAARFVTLASAALYTRAGTSVKGIWNTAHSQLARGAERGCLAGSAGLNRDCK
jgi:hypothetical protein